MTTDPALYIRNGGVRVTRRDAREIGQRLHERAMANKRHEAGDTVWTAWVAALKTCGLDVRIVRRDDSADAERAS